VDLVTGAVPEKEFGIVAVREGFTPDDDGIAALHTVGCTAELRDVRRLPDGRYDIVTRGTRRFKLLDLDAESKPYLMGSVELLPDTTEADPGGQAADLTRMLSASARAAHQRYCETAWKKGDWAEPAEDTTAATLPHVLAADCLLPMADRQRLLEQTSPTERLRMVRAFLARETGLLAQLRAVPAPIATYLVEHSTN
jgi:Lon protease-like protein